MNNAISMNIRGNEENENSVSSCVFEEKFLVVKKARKREDKF
jgi:hypothetical protein